MKKKLIFFLIALVVLSLFSSFNSPVKAQTTETVYASKDAHVYSRYPNNNYGDWTQMYCGIWNDGPTAYHDEVYIHFSFSSISSGWDDVRLCLDMEEVSKVLYFDVYRTSGSWSESSITWNTRPSHGEFLFYFEISYDMFGCLDVTEDISGTSFSICICATYNQDDTILITSREYASEYYHPQLEFTYNPSSSGSQFNPTITIIAVCSVLGGGGALAALYINKKRKREVPPETTPSTPTETQPVISTNFCPNCGMVLRTMSKFCPNCGKQLK